MSPSVWAHLDLSALQHNLAVCRKHAPHAKHMAVIKADAYGHGMIQAARALRDADAFAVARLEEAVALREAGITHPIVLLEGVSRAEDLKAAQTHRLELVVHHAQQIAMLEQASGPAVQVWLKIDTGMHRLGFPPQDAAAIYARLTACSLVAQPLRLLTHLANADDRRDSYTERQCKRFIEATQGLAGERSIANSAGILGWPQTHADWVRPGIALYGVSPFLDSAACTWDLKPAMTLRSSLIAVQRRCKGEPIGYGGSWLCPQDMPVGVAAVGYGDGYPRHAKAGAPVLVNGQRVALIGRVSMDMICLDLRVCPQAQVGDPVVLWGESLPVEDIASHADTIAYELFCRLTPRVHFDYRE